MLTLFSIYEYTTIKYKNKTAIIDNGRHITYGDLIKKECMLASSFSKLGIGHGSVVGVQLPGNELFVETFFALQRLGAVIVPFNTHLNADMTLTYINQAHIDYFIYISNLDEQIAQIKGKAKSVRHWIRSNNHCGFLEQLLYAGDPDFHAVCPIRPDDAAIYIFTSGTTGTSKVVVNTFHNLLMWLITDESHNIFSENDIYLNYSPMNHAAGLGRLIRIICTGATLIMLKKFDVEIFLDICEQEHPTGILLIPPTYCYRIAEALEKRLVDLSCFTRIETGATIVPPDTIKKMFELFPNATIYTGYGQSECKSITHLHFTKKEYLKNPAIIESIGIASYNCHIRLVDENFCDVPEGAVGEALVKSPLCMPGYLNSSAGFHDGWLMTGDYLRKDANGYYYFVDRKRDIIKTGGEMVSSYEVESVLYNHPDISACAVLGIPDRLFTESVCAVIVCEKSANLTKEKVIAYAQKYLPGFKVPRQVIFINDMPRTPTGKIQKNKLRLTLKKQHLIENF